ncbi:CHAD domain-containing protein [Dictyobacter formicarum]|uniref:CHAD domain-containing protein n=1 Tax=Dictyobacter formicarum TaxID=2778368 RepID=A0ABQ3VPN4_9CHLR|nr:CHAD domain-containing protein [Dictyobacter formicarum]GHO87341.1 hypothetical protein KSZ_53470 [Dictyobacter formicarum]
MAKASMVTDLDLHASTGKNARAIARVRLAEMFSWETYVDDPYAVQNLHNLRIAAKRLRYTLEIFEDTFPEECASIIKDVEQIQEELGSLHDNDVMVALLRLCLGGQDSGAVYEQALLTAARQGQKKRPAVNPALVEHLLQPSTPLVAEQREGLELLLRDLQQHREHLYKTFYQHWYQLKQQNFQHKILNLLADNE